NLGDRATGIGAAASRKKDQGHTLDRDSDGVECAQMLDRGDSFRCWHIGVAVGERDVRMEFGAFGGGGRVDRQRCGADDITKVLEWILRKGAESNCSRRAAESAQAN